ncbi:hypothetical protein ACNKU7_07860 [Microbulbifer sp. SA54]
MDKHPAFAANGVEAARNPSSESDQAGKLAAWVRQGIRAENEKYNK